MKEMLYDGEFCKGDTVIYCDNGDGKASAYHVSAPDVYPAPGTVGIVVNTYTYLNNKFCTVKWPKDTLKGDLVETAIAANYLRLNV